MLSCCIEFFHHWHSSRFTCLLNNWNHVWRDLSGKPLFAQTKSRLVLNILINKFLVAFFFLQLWIFRDNCRKDGKCWQSVCGKCNNFIDIMMPCRFHRITLACFEWTCLQTLAIIITRFYNVALLLRNPRGWFAQLQRMTSSAAKLFHQRTNIYHRFI